MPTQICLNKGFRNSSESLALRAEKVGVFCKGGVSVYAGYIKLHRKLLEWEWYSDTNVKIVFLHCLLMANHDDTKWRGAKPWNNDKGC